MVNLKADTTSIVKALALSLVVLLLNPASAFASEISAKSLIDSQLERQELKMVATHISSEMPAGYIKEPLEMASDTLESLFGITPDMYDTFYGEFSSVENSLDTFIIVKSTEAEVDNLFGDYLYKMESSASLVDEKQVKNAETERIGEYIVFSLLKDKENNEMAIELAVDYLK